MIRGVVAHQGRAVVRQVPRPKLAPGHVRMRVLAAGINRADLLQVAGKYNPPPSASQVLGLECAGVLPDGTIAGALVSGGALAEEVSVPVGSLLRLPMEAEKLAAVPEAFLVAHHLLFQLGGFSQGQSALITAAGSGVGTALTQLAAQVPDGIVIASARGARKRECATTLGAGVVIDPSTGVFAEEVRNATGGKGAHLLLDCVGGSLFREHARSLRTNAKWILYGLLGGARAADLSLAPLIGRRIQLISTTLRYRSDEYKALLVEQFMKMHSGSLLSGEIAPVIDTVFEGLDSCSGALEYMAADKNAGKIVVKVAT